MWRAVWSKSFATILPIHHNHYSLQTRHIKNQIHFFSTSLQFKYNVDTLQPIHPPNYSPPTNSSRQYHNQQNYHSIRLDSNLPDLPSPYTANKLKSTIHKHPTVPSAALFSSSSPRSPIRPSSPNKPNTPNSTSSVVLVLVNCCST